MKRLAGFLDRGASNPILSNRSGTTYDDLKVGPGTVVKVAAGDYRMWYEGIDDTAASDDPTTACYATSTDGTSWAKYASNPVLSGGVAWENNEVSPVSVVYDPVTGKWRMWYHGGNNTGPRAIGHAESTDGITSWAKYASNPILQKGSAGAWDETFVADAKVMILGSADYRMWYMGVNAAGLRRVGYATSTDGLSWTKSGSNPIFTVGAGGAWDDNQLLAFCPLRMSDGSFVAWYIGNADVAGTSGIGFAYSADGIAWTRGAYNPVLKEVTDDDPEDSIHVYWDDGDIRVVYGLYDLDAPGGAVRGKGDARLVARDLPLPSEGTASILVDDFNRADDSSPPPGANWTNGVLTFTGGEGLVIVSNQVTRLLTGGYRQGGTYTARKFGPDCGARIKLAAISFSGAPAFSLWVRLRNLGASTTQGYGLLFDFTSATTGEASFYRADAGIGTMVNFTPGETCPVPVAAGDEFEVRAVGSLISYWHKPNGGEWTRLFAIADATYPEAGYVGLEVADGQQAKFDDLRVQHYDVPAGEPRFVAAGTGQSALTSPLTVPVPTDVQKNDIIVIHSMTRDNAQVLNTPTGFTASGLGLTTQGTILRHNWFWKRADGTEGGTNVSVARDGGSLLFAARCYVFRGCVETGAPYEDEANGGGAANPVTMAAKTPGHVRRLVVALISNTDDDENLPNLTGSNVTFTEDAEFSTATGLDGTLQLCTAPTGTVVNVNAATYNEATADTWQVRSFCLIPRPGARALAAGRSDAVHRASRW